MGQKLLSKLSMIVSVVTILGLSSAAFVAHRFLHLHLSSETNHRQALRARKVAKDIRHLLEDQLTKSKVLLDLMKDRSQKGTLNLAFVKEQMIRNPALAGFTIYESSIKGDWSVGFRLIRPRGNSFRITRSKLNYLRKKYPIPFDQIHEKQHALVPAKLEDGSRIIRLATFIGKNRQSKDQILEVHLIQRELEKILEPMQDSEKLIVSTSSGLVLAREHPNLVFRENISHFKIIERSKSSKKPFGSLSFHEIPGEKEHVGSFYREDVFGFLVLSQIPKKVVLGSIKAFQKELSLTLGIISIVCITILVLTFWALVTRPFTRLIESIQGYRDGEKAIDLPDFDSRDEFYVISEDLKSLLNQVNSPAQDSFDENDELEEEFDEILEDDENDLEASDDENAETSEDDNDESVNASDEDGNEDEEEGEDQDSESAETVDEDDTDQSEESEPQEEVSQVDDLENEDVNSEENDEDEDSEEAAIRELLGEDEAA